MERLGVKGANTVMGVPEPKFRERWVAMLWQAMSKTGRGYAHSTLKNRPPKGAAKWRGERRPDKIGTTKLGRRLALKVHVA